MNGNWIKILVFSLIFGILGFILGHMCGSHCGGGSCGRSEMHGDACMEHGGMQGMMHGKKDKCCAMMGDSAMAGHGMDDHAMAHDSAMAE
jgi:hypothetical protein